MILEAFQREDVSAYMGLNTAVTKHKYKQAVICEQEHMCSQRHTPYLQIQLHNAPLTQTARYTWAHIQRTILKL